MSNGQNVDKFHLRDLLRTVLHAQLLLQCAMSIVIQHLQGDARLHRTDTTGNSMFDNTVDPRMNAFAYIIMSDSITGHLNTDAKVPDVTVCGDIQHPDIEARDEVTDILQDGQTQPKKSTDCRPIN